MLQYLKNEANRTLTENGAETLATTGSDCLDLFATIGALRRADDAEIETRFMRAFTENSDIAMKLLFFARDVRGGLGERRVFRVILNWLAHNEPESLRKNLEHVAEYGRFDDLLTLLGTSCEKEIQKQIPPRIKECNQAIEDGEKFLENRGIDKKKRHSVKKNIRILKKKKRWFSKQRIPKKLARVKRTKTYSMWEICKGCDNKNCVLSAQYQSHKSVETTSN